jgi:predicted nucleic acid-binding protein
LTLRKRFFRKHADHQHSFTDCTSFVVMRELKLSQALMTDHHFSQAGFDAFAYHFAIGSSGFAEQSVGR